VERFGAQWRSRQAAGNWALSVGMAGLARLTAARRSNIDNILEDLLGSRVEAGDGLELGIESDIRPAFILVKSSAFAPIPGAIAVQWTTSSLGWALPAS
jgi:hypothetical protein